MNEFGLGGGKLPAVTVGVQLASPEMLAAVGKDMVEGLIVVAPNWTTKSQVAMLPDMQKRANEPWLGQDTISTYGDVMLIKDAIERAGSAGQGEGDGGTARPTARTVPPTTTSATSWPSTRMAAASAAPPASFSGRRACPIWSGR